MLGKTKYRVQVSLVMYRQYFIYRCLITDLLQYITKFHEVYINQNIIQHIYTYVCIIICPSCLSLHVNTSKNIVAKGAIVDVYLLYRINRNCNYKINYVLKSVAIQYLIHIRI